MCVPCSESILTTAEKIDGFPSSAGFAGAFVDREVETRGVSRRYLVRFGIAVTDVCGWTQMDTFDREKAKYEARQQCEGQLDSNQWQ